MTAAMPLANRQAGLGPFQGGQLGLHGLPGGVAVAAVLLAARGPALHVLHEVAVLGKVKVELRTRGGVMEKSPFGRGSPPWTARVEGPSRRASSLRGITPGWPRGWSMARRTASKSAGSSTGRLAWRASTPSSVPPVVADLELRELEAVGGGDHDHALARAGSRPAPSA